MPKVRVQINDMLEMPNAKAQILMKYLFHEEE
jgi:hypothetical protein